MGRPSQIEVEVAQSGKKLTPRVSGAAVKVFEGRDPILNLWVAYPA